MKKLISITLIVFLTGLLFSSYVSAGEEKRIEKTFDVKEGGKLDIDLETGGDIFIEGCDRNTVGVEVLITGKNSDNVEIEFDKTQDGLKIDLEYRKKLRRNNTDCRVLVKVPGRFDIEFETVGGDVEIMNVEGRIKGESMGGDLEFVKLKGTVRVTTMGGDITVEECELDGRVKTMGGDVKIENLKGDLRGSSMGGEVKYIGVKRSKTRGDWDDEDEEINVSSFGGDLDLDFEGKVVKGKTFGGDIDVGKSKEAVVKTMGGDIDIEYAPEGADAHTMGGDITIGSVGKYVKAKTMGGDVEVKAIDGRVKATTMGGDVNVVMVGDPDDGDREVELKSMGGDIELIVPKGLSMEFDIEIAYTKDCRKKCEIISDFNMEIEETEEWQTKWFQKRKYIYGKGDVGGGKNLIKIRTTNGTVRIKESR